MKQQKIAAHYVLYDDHYPTICFYKMYLRIIDLLCHIFLPYLLFVKIYIIIDQSSIQLNCICRFREPYHLNLKQNIKLVWLRHRYEIGSNECSMPQNMFFLQPFIEEKLIDFFLLVSFNLLTSSCWHLKLLTVRKDALNNSFLVVIFLRCRNSIFCSRFLHLSPLVCTSSLHFSCFRILMAYGIWMKWAE